jgi:hypothetical protein
MEKCANNLPKKTGKQADATVSEIKTLESERRYYKRSIQCRKKPMKAWKGPRNVLL